MKKALAILLAVIMSISLLTVTGFAENGPKPYDEDVGMSGYVNAFELDSEGERADFMYCLFDSYEEFEPDELEGVSYDRDSNTLLLDNLCYPELCFEAYAMGDDFTVYVKGICEVAGFEVQGDGYGGSVTFTGPGKLLINKEGYRDVGIVLSAGKTQSKLDFGSKVSVEIYGDEAVATVSDTTVEEAAKAIVFENGEQHSVTGGPITDITYETAYGFYMLDPETLEEPQTYGYEAECADDPDGIYCCIPESTEDEEGNTVEVYQIIKMIYVEEYSTYVPDINAFDGSAALIVPVTDLEAYGFTLKLDAAENPIEFVNENPSELNVAVLGVDEEGNIYGMVIEIYSIDFETGDVDMDIFIYDLVEIEGIEGIYYFEENKDIDPESLSQIEKTVIVDDSSFNYAIDENPFIYTGISFPDVAAGEWYAAPAMYNAYNGYINGFSDGRFGPAESLQRQDFVVMLARILGADLNAYEGETGNLADVKAGAYYAAAIAWAVDNGFVHGYDDGNFGVGDRITREQVATILFGIFGSDSGDESWLAGFTDRARISGFAENAMTWAVTNGIITGKNSTTLAPVDFASRAEVATIIMRMDQNGLLNA